MVHLPGQPASGGAKIPRVGILWAGGGLSETAESFAEPFGRGLADLGYTEGQNIVLEWRADLGGEERLTQNVADLISLNLDVIVAVGDNRARVTREATRTIPVVLSQGVDPVGLGLIDGFARPGGNVTGTIEGNLGVLGVRLQLLRELVPRITRVTVLGSMPSTTPARLQALEAAAPALGLQLRVLRVPTADALAEALEREADEHPDALLVVHSGLISGQRDQVLDFAARHGLPSMYGTRIYASAGGLAAYGPNVLDIHYRSASYVDKILKGARTADLPVELPTTFDFIVNLKTAQALGLTIPQSVLQQATEVIQ
jgi:putative ABC transport system substrate-binding protein